MEPCFDTTTLKDLDQRWKDIPNVGLVIGTCGTLPYIHLQLEMAARLFGRGGLPILVVNDGKGDTYEEQALADLCADYGAHFLAGDYCGHTGGDCRVFRWGLEWAKEMNIQLLAKFSRRYVPLKPWRYSLLAAASMNPDAAIIGRRQNDSSRGMFRTDACALRVEKMASPKVMEDLAEGEGMDRVCVEQLVEALGLHVGGYQQWDFIHNHMADAHANALQWRGCLPPCYGDLSRELGLPYPDVAFLAGRFGTVKEELPETKRINDTIPDMYLPERAEILEVVGGSNDN